MQHPARRLRVGTLLAHRAVGTRLRGKHHFNAFPRPTPAATLLTLWTDRHLGLPVQLKVRHIKALACSGLPTVVGQGRTNQADPVVLLTADPQLSIDIARIHQLLLWE